MDEPSRRKTGGKRENIKEELRGIGINGRFATKLQLLGSKRTYASRKGNSVEVNKNLKPFTCT